MGDSIVVRVRDITVDEQYPKTLILRFALITVEPMHECLKEAMEKHGWTVTLESHVGPYYSVRISKEGGLVTANEVRQFLRDRGAEF